MKEITKDMRIAQVLKLDKSLADVFMGFGMFCIFCHLGEEETIEEACQVHEIDEDLLLSKLNETLKDSLAKKNKKEAKN